ncbi:adhesion G protein-coupled receptor F5-like [Amblyraja radiata]|uniref:adhesion G protein-coupled receptor F5-like n=1 Tax=Amblyraja radiata TaxID=386614 RepID=UPI001402B86E|nr:adhesion G protein-coupled receptor F5-like [Amblyraja radiata]
MLPRTRIMSWCLLLTFFYQQVEVDEPHSSNSPLPAVDASITEDSKSQIHLIRQRRNVNQQTEYTIDIEISISRNGLSTLQMDLANLSYPIILPIGNGTINITSITPTTSCQLVNSEIQCTCTSEFIWNSTFCRKYQPCSANTTATQTCDCIRGYPTEGVFCDDSPIMTTPAQSTAPTTRAKTTTTRAKTTTTTLPTTTPFRRVKKNIGLEILSQNFTAELKDSSSELYQSLTNEVTVRLNEAYRTRDS